MTRHLLRMLAGCASAALLAYAAQATAQIAPERTLEELKSEIQARADRKAYPVANLDAAEVREVLATLRTKDRDEWATAWSVMGERHRKRADALRSTDAAAARAAYLKSWHYYLFARFPTENSAGKKRAYQEALASFAEYAKLTDPPVRTVRIPFEGKEIVGYYQMPRTSRPAPVVLVISALDGRKEDAAVRSEAFVPAGIGYFAVDMPGTGQAPIKVDVGAERMFSRVIDWLQMRPEVDATRIAVQGGSWSGYWAAKLAILERERLRAVVASAPGVHGYFQPDWQRKALGTREYLMELFAARASVYGVETLDDFLAYGPRLSLLTGGLVQKPATRMLLVNGERDTQIPIEDLYLLLRNGTPKEAWVNPDGAHMGRGPGWPDEKIFRDVIQPWLVRALTQN